MADHGGRPRRRPSLPAGLPVPAVRRRTPPSRSPSRGRPSSPTGWTSFSARSTGSTRTPTPSSLTDGRTLSYDYLVIASGVTPRPDQTPGMLGSQWRRSIFDFYTLDGAQALAKALAGTSTAAASSCTSPTCRSSARSRRWSSPSWPRRTSAQRGMRDRVEIVYVTPLPGAFTKPIASAQLGSMLDERKIAVEADFLVEHIDPDGQDARLLRRAGDPLRSAGDGAAEHGRRLRGPLRSRRRAQLRAGRQAHPAVEGVRNIFAVGDASDIPTSKAGSVAHFSVEVFVRQLPATTSRASR